MALTTYPVSPEEVVRMSDQLWSEVVGIASAENPPPAVEVGYQFSNGRTFDDAKGSYR
jgi:hypothetical protein